MTLYTVADDGGFGAITATAIGAITAGMFVRTDSTSIGGEITPGTTDPSAAFTVQAADASGDELLVVGLALTTATSGNLVTLATRGFFLLEGAGAVTAGTRVQCEDGTDPLEISDLSDATINNAHIGKALTGCSAANEFVLAKVSIA